MRRDPVTRSRRTRLGVLTAAVSAALVGALVPRPPPTRHPHCG